MNPRSRSAAFTLLELLVVLAILAIVTALAVRSLDGVQDQHRYEGNQIGFEQLNAAIVGSEDDRAPDGTRTVSGFVADLGRLPRTVTRTINTSPLLTLEELWDRGSIPPFAVRRATGIEITTPADEDAQIVLAVGWRGPYLRPALRAETLLDGWGNPYVSPVSGSEPAPRLLDASGSPLTTPGQSIGQIQHLGANGIPGGDLYDQDDVLDLAGDFQATLRGSIRVISEDPDDPEDTLEAIPPPGTKSVTVRVFGPNPENAAQLAVIARTTVEFASNPITWAIPASPAGATVGPRMVRAYLHASGDDVAGSATRRSAVKSVTVRPGENVVDFKIDRSIGQ